MLIERVWECIQGLIRERRRLTDIGSRSIRMGSHATNGPDFHYHEETWSYDPEIDQWGIVNLVRHVQPVAK